MGSEQGYGQEQNVFQSHGDPPTVVVALLLTVSNAETGLSDGGIISLLIPKNS